MSNNDHDDNETFDVTASDLNQENRFETLYALYVGTTLITTLEDIPSQKLLLNSLAGYFKERHLK